MSGARRRLLLGLAAAPLARAARAFDYPAVEPRRLVFPRDHGAHPGYRTEWWYLTGVLDAPAGSAAAALGVQLTFFRTRPLIDAANPSRFAAHQLILAHAALADPRRGALLHEERSARAGFGVAQAAEADTAVEVDRWSLARDAASGAYHGRMQGEGFAIELVAAPTQPVLLQGDAGYSVKGRDGDGRIAASFYYSQPQLALSARVRVEAVDSPAEWRSGRAWLDHEWSSALLPRQAAGWDWAGFNLHDGSSLTVFRVRAQAGPDGQAALAQYACWRAAGGPPQRVAAEQIRFEPLTYWVSPRTRARYPVAQRIVAGTRRFETRPWMPDQELDARATSGVAYWEGPSELLEDGKVVGVGYLELTGYAGPVP